jgi:hypothetical protein
MWARATIAAVALAAAFTPAAQTVRATHAPPRCSPAQLSLISPQTQGTATQAVAFVSLFNEGSACSVNATVTLAVVQRGTLVSSIRGNPVSYRIAGPVRHGVTALFDVWWSDWCGDRRAFDTRAAMGSLTATAPYHVLPDCLGRNDRSRLTGVRETQPSPYVGP